MWSRVSCLAEPIKIVPEVEHTSGTNSSTGMKTKKNKREIDTTTNFELKEIRVYETG